MTPWERGQLGMLCITAGCFCIDYGQRSEGGLDWLWVAVAGSWFVEGAYLLWKSWTRRL